MYAFDGHFVRLLSEFFLSFLECVYASVYVLLLYLYQPSWDLRLYHFYFIFFLFPGR
jgi:hypothetical protein